MKVEPYKRDQTILSCEALSDTLWKFKLKNDYNEKLAIRATLKLYSNGLLTDSIKLAGINLMAPNESEKFIFRPKEKSIQIIYSSDLINNRPWNIYRSESENGCYKKVNSMPIIGTYYEDMDLKPHTIYYYKVARLNSAMIEQEQSQPIKSGTTFYSGIYNRLLLNIL